MYAIRSYYEAAFPRFKPGAGWVTPQVFRDLEINSADYPLGINQLSKFQVAFKNFHFQLNTNQYAIRRIEFDNWLLQRSGAPVIQHAVKDIRQEDGRYIIRITSYNVCYTKLLRFVPIYRRSKQSRFFILLLPISWRNNFV